MVQKVLLAMAIVVFKRVLLVLKDKAADSVTSLDDIAIQAVSDVVDLYESGQLQRLLQG